MNKLLITVVTFFVSLSALGNTNNENLMPGWAEATENQRLALYEAIQEKNFICTYGNNLTEAMSQRYNLGTALGSATVLISTDTDKPPVFRYSPGFKALIGSTYRLYEFKTDGHSIQSVAMTDVRNAQVNKGNLREPILKLAPVTVKEYPCERLTVKTNSN